LGNGLTEIIAEIGLQHDGSLRDALAFVRACAKRGVDTVKFQCHQSDPNAHFRKGTEHHFPQDESRFRYWQRTGFQQHEWERIKQECDDCGVEFLCTPFSVVAAEMLNPLVKRWKIGSGNVQDHELLAFVYKTDKPIIFSNGMRQQVHYELKQRNALELACISKYPTPLSEALSLVDEVKHTLRWGWSSHTGLVSDSIQAIEGGAEVIEVHVCWHKEQGGPDVESALPMDGGVHSLTYLAAYAKTKARESA
jgi:N,N'-diacetyllegionaminate synthase